jgi:hypothetical protein
MLTAFPRQQWFRERTTMLRNSTLPLLFTLLSHHQTYPPSVITHTGLPIMRLTVFTQLTHWKFSTDLGDWFTIDICALLGCYAASSGNPSPMFRDNVSVPSSRVKKSNECCFIGLLDPWRWDRYVVPKRRWTVTTRRCLTPQKSADLISIAAEAWNHNRSWPT